MSKPVFKSTAAPGSPPAAGGARKGLASFTEELAAGDYVFREGELGTEMFILQEGQVEILKTLDGVDEQLAVRSEEHTSELQSQSNLVCRLLLEKKNKT